ncbi:hypothetical protein HMPREF3227_02150 [Corynebacterium sp. CMW7794]|nr:hypothetical protein HMPREF3227_02150 [Corynebacterium sp. CMW7794]
MGFLPPEAAHRQLLRIFDMRIRKAAIAGATALAVAFSGASIATAAEAPSDQNTTSSNQTENKGGSSKIGDALDADTNADGRKIFGQDADVSSQPAWAQALYGIGIASAVVTVIGGLVGPALNFIKFGPIKF